MRLFVAVWPPSLVLEEIARLPRPVVPDVRWTTRDQWHVTLRFLGEVASFEEVVESLSATSLPVAEAELGQVVRRLGSGVLCVDVHGLGPVAEAVTTATAAMGRPPESRAFHGHLTLARAGRRGPDLRSLAGTPVQPSRFAVRLVAVVQSHLGRAGARYETVAEVPCG
jgi:2'-5' RNA ligase